MPAANYTQSVNASGANQAVQPQLSDIQGGTLVSEFWPRYYQAAYQKKVFAAVAAGVTSTVGLATTYTGLCVTNPIGSTVNLVMMKVGLAQSVINAAVNAAGFGFGFSATTAVTQTTPVTTQSCFANSITKSAALAASAVTLPAAPVYAGFFNSTPTATTNFNGVIADLEGSIVIPPGGYFVTLTAAASPAAALWLSAQWLELPV